MPIPNLRAHSRVGGWSHGTLLAPRGYGRVARQVTVGSAPVAAPAKNDPLSKLQLWAEESGISAPKLRIFQLKGTAERGLQATEPIRAGEELVKVPRQLAVVVGDSDKCKYPDIVDPAFFKTCSRTEKLALVLLCEKSLGDDSKVTAYINSLPQDIQLPFMWSDEELKLIRNEGVRGLIEKSKARCNEVFKDLKASSPACTFTKEQFDWALSCVLSRSFLGPHPSLLLKDWLNLMLLVSGATALSLTFGLFPEDQVLTGAFASVCFSVIYSQLRGQSLREQVLCPLIDMANYRGNLEGDGAELSYEFFSNSYTVSAGANFLTNKEVFISYGDQISDSLLQRFGFVDSDATQDKYTFYGVDKKLKALPQITDEKWKVLEGAVESEKVPPFSKMVTDSKTRIDDRVLGALRYLLGVSDDLDKALEMKSSSADRVVFEFVLELAQAEEGAGAEAVKAQKAALGMAKKLGKDREVLAHQYNISKFVFLGDRISQLRRRIEKMA